MTPAWMHTKPYGFSTFGSTGYNARPLQTFQRLPKTIALAPK